jgi:fumarylacetoacetase
MINVGKVMAPNAPPMPNFKWLPVAYHGRSSSVAISGTAVCRPYCQAKPPTASQPSYGPSTKLDYEFEFGAIMGKGNKLGEPISTAEAEHAIYGLCILNDWSMRDIQAWESMPLGPFLSKNFLTTLSPWVVSMDALRPFRVHLPRTVEDPEALDYLRPPQNANGITVPGAIDIQMEAWLTPLGAEGKSLRLSRSSFRHCYWSLSQMVAHHTSNGCNLNVGDLIGTGTQSGPEDGEQGCLIELTQDGKRPLQLTDKLSRTYLQDGDSLQLRAWCESSTHRKIGFGSCAGQIQPANTDAQ